MQIKLFWIGLKVVFPYLFYDTTDDIDIILVQMFNVDQDVVKGENNKDI